MRNKTRYPGDAGMMPDGKPKVQDVMEFYEFAREVYEKLKDTLCRDDR